MTLVTYLDTQDYLSLFYEGDTGPKNDVLDGLLAMRNEGLVAFGYSFATIVEVITKPDTKHREERVMRGALIKRICGRNAFPYLTDLAKGARFPNNGQWMMCADQPVLSARKFRKEMRESFLEKLGEENLNREQRRKLKSVGFSTLLRQSGNTWGRRREDYGDIPVTDEIVESRLLERFMKGRCSDKEFEETMTRWLFDPEEFSRIFYDYGDQPNALDNFFGKQVDTLESVITQIQGMVENFAKLNSTLLDTRKTLVDIGLSKAEARKITKQVSIPTVNAEEFDPQIEAVLGEGRAAHFRHYLNRVTKSKYDFKRSDVMDLMQMTYAYDCDLFRCDKAMAATFSNFDPFKGKLVQKFEDLPDCIREKSKDGSSA